MFAVTLADIELINYHLPEHVKLEGKYSLESTIPAKAKFAPICGRNSLLSKLS